MSEIGVEDYSYFIEDEKIREYAKLSAADKLRWLEEIDEFNNKVLTPEQREIREKLRRGGI